MLAPREPKKEPLMNRLTQTSRLFLALLFALVGIASPLTQMAAQAGSPPVPATWQLNVGASSSDQAIQTNFFFTDDITIHVGDSIAYNFRSGEIHTVSLLSNGPTPAFPAFGPIGGTAQNAVYDGTNQVSSGINTAFGGPFGFGPYTVKFTNTGDFKFQCLVHGTMHGTVHVVPVNKNVPHDQPWYDKKAQSDASKDLKQGAKLQDKGLKAALKAGPRQIQAGYGDLEKDGTYSIMRFQPDTTTQPLKIKVHQTVTWTNPDPETPHTVSINYSAPDPFTAAIPAGLDPGNPIPGHATITTGSESINSGWIGVTPGVPFLRGTTFSVKFDHTGTYQFHCELHDQLGMTGQVEVDP
jgi:plastocyanin